MNTLQWSEKALRQIQKIKDKREKQHIYLETRCLLNFPDCQNVKRLTNHRFRYRLRVGSWRVFFDFDGDVKIVSIEEVKKRNEHTY